MFCRNCGNQMDPQAVVCVKCGVPVGKGTAFCPNCGQQTPPEAAFCTSCGIGFGAPTGAPIGVDPSMQKSKIVAGILGIFFGSIGIHNFYLGYTKRAVLQIVLTIVTCGAASLWGFIEGILILCGSTITQDANGIPLKD